MMRTLQRLGIAAAALVSMAATSSAYYYFVHYPSRTGPFVPVPEKFDLAALPGKTVSLFVPDIAPTQLAPGDSFPSIVSQIRLAAAVWNDVDTSDLRVSFGGLFSPGTQQNTPHIEVMFDDVPGALANCAPISRVEPVTGPGGAFVPIAVSTCLVNRDLTQRPSFGEPFFLTLVHELGHALGLQHTFTSSVMSTEPTRGTTRSTPLASDDIAGISSLYPTARFYAQTGSIAGQVLMGNAGVSMASVVALTPDRNGFSAVTNPDGTYRIDGVPPGQYYVYVHPLPPTDRRDLGPGETRLPLGPDGQPFPASDPFETQFYPGTKDPQQATQVPVSTGAVSAGINFQVQRRAPLDIISVTTYSFPGSVAVKPAFLSPAGTQSLMAISTGLGLTANGAPLNGLTVSVLGAAASVQRMQAYPPAQQYLQLDLALNGAAPGPRHLIFSYNNDLYVLPSAFWVTSALPPFISGVTAGFDSSGRRVAMVSGTNLNPDTRILFDGLLTARSPDFMTGGVMVYPPPGGSSYAATVTALNSDGQSSLFLQAQTPALYLYDAAEPPSIALSATSLPAGAEAMIEITGVNTNFAEGQTRVGFGSSDIVVRSVWVLSPTRLRAEVFVAPSAAQVSTLVSVTSGFQVISQPFAFQVQPSNPRLLVINPALINAATGQPGVSAGDLAILNVTNLPVVVTPGSYTVTLNDVAAPVVSNAPGQVVFQVPANTPPGPAVLRLLAGGADQAYPVIVSTDAPRAVVNGVMSVTGIVDANHPARPGELLTVMVSGLAETGTFLLPTRVRVNVGGLDHPVMFVTSTQTGHQVLFALSPTLATGQYTMTVSLERQTCLPYTLPVRTL